MSDPSSLFDPLSPEDLQRLEDVCCQFEQGWLDGHPPRLEDALDGLSDLERPAFLRELLRLEVYYRRQVGEPVSAEEYHQRFPDATAVINALWSAAAPQPETVDESHPPGSAAGQSTVDDVSPPEPLAETSRDLRIPTVPGYEIVKELGRGAMGVVYEARLLALKRPVALKMVLAGAHAGSEQRARFRVEAEAVARLVHPHIVQIHEVGEADGCPYCALEFVERGSLSKKLQSGPLSPREAAQLVEALARGMQLAHSRNVVHRDLKPANVLLTGDGTPKVSDFGLARHLDVDSGQTEAGAVMGTPSYMAPEQAEGRAHEAGPPADVYALGAILYECLTGRPPFRGRTIVETLEQVRKQPPLPPSRLRAGVPPGLETVVLKCLRKEPEGRYASAAELAEELGRCLRGEPVLARPVGPLERGWLWCKRNPKLAVALATVLGVLVIGSLVTTLFGIDASNKAAAAERAGNDLAQKKKDLEDEKDRIRGKNTELEQSKDALDGAQVRTLLSPLLEGPGPLNEAELTALTGLAAIRDKPTALRFVSQALRDPQGMRRLRNRAPFALHAAVGLNEATRQEAEKRLIDALVMPDLTDKPRVDVALAASDLGGLSPHAAALVARTLAQAVSRTKDHDGLVSLAQVLKRVAPQVDAQEAAEVAASITEAMTQTTDPDALRLLAEGLSAVAARLEPKEAAKVCAPAADALVQTLTKAPSMPLAEGLVAVSTRLEPMDSVATLLHALTKTNAQQVQQRLAQELVTVAARLDSKDATKSATAIAQALTNAPGQFAADRLVEGLAAVAARLDSKDAAELASGFARDLASADRSFVEDVLAKVLSVVAARLEPKEAAKVCAPAGAALAQALATNPRDAWRLAQGLSAVAARMEPNEAMFTLVQALAKSTDVSTQQHLAQSLSAVAARMEPTKEGAADLARVLPQARDPFTALHLAQGLSAVAARMEPKAAARICAPAAAALAQAPVQTVMGDGHVSEPMTPALSAVAAWLEPKDAAGPAAALAQALAKEGHFFAAGRWVDRLSVVAARLDAKGAAEPAAVLVEALSKATDPEARKQKAAGLLAVTARLEPKEAAKVHAQAAAALALALAQAPDPYSDAHLSAGLSAVLARTEPKAGATALAQALPQAGRLFPRGFLADALSARMEPKDGAAVLTEALAKATDPSITRPLAQGLSAVAARMEPRDAKKVSAAVATKLAKAIASTSDVNALHYLPEGLSAVGAGLEPGEAAEACAALSQAMSRTTDPHALGPLSTGLSAAAVHLPPKAAAECAATLWTAMTRTNYGHALQYLAKGLSAVSARMEPKEAARVWGDAAAKLTQAMSETTDPVLVGAVVEGLLAVAGRMEPTEAARVSAKAAATLIPAMMRSSNSRDRKALASVLSALAAYMETGRVIVVLAEAMCRTTHPSDLRFLAEWLSATATHMESRAAAKVSMEDAETLVLAMRRAIDLNAFRTSNLELLAAHMVENANALRTLAEALAAVTLRLDSRETSNLAAQGAGTLMQVMSKTGDPNALRALAQGLSAVAARMEPREAAQASAHAARTLIQVMSTTNDPNALRTLAEGLSAVAARMEPREASNVSTVAAALLTLALSRNSNPDSAQALSTVLGDQDESPRRHRIRAVAATVGYLQDNRGFPGALVLLRPAAEPFRHWLSDQELVELLKLPLCVGPARRAILDHLGNRHGRTFTDQWDFVRFAEERKLGLDFTNPTQRP
jgi:hypothetical protein